MGYHRAGFDVVGVDHKPQKNYPFEFQQVDALEFCAEHGHEYDAIHASPPCQPYSCLRHLPFLRERCEKHLKLIDPVRLLVVATRRLWVIENTMGAPLSGMFLCGGMFGLLVFRHRRFESNVFMLAPMHVPHREIIGSGKFLNDRKRGSLRSGSRAGEFSRSRDAWKHHGIVTVAGNQFQKPMGEKALGIDWMSKYELTQAIPPAYTEFIGRQLMQALKEKRRSG